MVSKTLIHKEIYNIISPKDIPNLSNEEIKYKDFYDFDVLTSSNDLSLFESLFSDDRLCPFCQSLDVEKM